MLKKYFLVFLVFALLTPSSLAFADRGERRGFHGDFHREYVVHRLPPGYVSLLVGGLSLLYCEGLFYRYSPAGYVVVTPPVGAVIPALPPGYTTVVANGMPYYYYGYTYYSPTPNGYVVAAPPAAPVLPAPVSVPMQAAPPAPQAVAPPAAPAPAAPPVGTSTVAHPALYGTPNKEEPNRDIYEIYIPNGNGSFTSVTLRKTEKGFLGPQGEFYADHPTIEQLKERYTKK